MKKIVLMVLISLSACSSNIGVDYLKSGVPLNELLSGTTWTYTQGRQQKIIEFKKQTVRLAVSEILGTDFVPYQIVSQTPDRNVITFHEEQQQLYIAFQFLGPKLINAVSWQGNNTPVDDSIITQALEQNGRHYKLTKQVK